MCFLTIFHLYFLYYIYYITINFYIYITKKYTTKLPIIYWKNGEILSSFGSYSNKPNYNTKFFNTFIQQYNIITYGNNCVNNNENVNILLNLLGINKHEIKIPQVIRPNHIGQLPYNGYFQ